MDNRVEKIRELLADPAFGEEIKDLQELEEFQAAFRRHGVEMTLQETDSVLLQAAASNGEDLTEEQLEQVAGGFAVTGALLIGGGILLCYGVGWAVGRYIKKKTGVCP